MSFLSAAFLFALPLVAAPVAIHLYRGRQRETVMWGAMQFLTAAATKGRRMERIEEWLLMAVRFAAVAALVFALARPMVRSGLFGQTSDREVILIVDNSLSMSREVGGESSADRLKNQATELVDSLASGDGVQVLLAAGHEWATTAPITADSGGKRQLREIISSAEPTLGTAELLECLQATVHLEPGDEITNRRIVIFTDGQAGSWQTDASAAWRQLSADRDAAAIPIEIEVVECGGAGRVENLAVNEVQAARNFIRPGEEAELTVTIGNVGDTPIEATQVEWLLNGKVEQSNPLTAMEPHTTAEASARLTFPKAGLYQVTCRIVRQDQVPLDQENHVVVEVAEQLPILFVAGGSAREGAVAAQSLLAAALGYKNSEPQAWHSAYRPEVIEPNALATHPWADYRAILINNPDLIRSDTLERLDTYVRGGGGLWVALGDQTDRAAFNRDWYSDGDGLSPSAIEALVVVDKAEDIGATVHPPSRDHAATLQLANTTQLDIDEARVRQRWKFAEQGATGEGQAVSVLLESGNGQPLALEKFVGQGRVIVQSFPLGLEWSNLPLLKSYVVMVHDWLDYVSAPTAARYNLPRGGVIAATAPKDAAANSATLVSPQGREFPLALMSDDVAPVFRYSQTRLPGMYTVRIDDAGQTVQDIPFYIEREAGESDLRPLSDADRAALLTPAGVLLAGSEPSVREKAVASPRREPIWSPLLAALVVLLAIELLMSNWLSQRRSGMAVSTA
jgi:hypothetical protein